MYTIYTAAEDECPIGSYISRVSDSDEEVCVLCPRNSVSFRADSTQCDCLQGYYRTQLEGPNYECSGEKYVLFVKLLKNFLKLKKYFTEGKNLALHA